MGKSQEVIDAINGDAATAIRRATEQIRSALQSVHGSFDLTSLQVHPRTFEKAIDELGYLADSLASEERSRVTVTGPPDLVAEVAERVASGSDRWSVDAGRTPDRVRLIVRGGDHE